jgi:four helix bundle protein
MERTDLSDRTKLFALEIIKFYQKLPLTGAAKVMGDQLLRCGTSVAANYRASRRARSDREFYSKLCIVVEETDETGLWLELISESGISEDPSLTALMKEAQELLFIFSSSRKTFKDRMDTKRK